MDKKTSSTQSHSAGSPDQTDTILVVENVEILVHRNMLSVLSPYFERLLLGGFKEKNETRIEVKEVKLEAFSDCLDIMNGVDLKYTPGQMGLERLSNLLSFADRFDIDVVRMFCQWEMNFESPGQEVDRYLLACDHMLPDQTKERLRSFVTSDTLSSWSENVLSAKETESPFISLRIMDLARVIAISSGTSVKAEKIDSNVSTDVCAAASHPPSPKKKRCNPPPKNVPSPIESLVDAYIEVEGVIFPVNKSMMCHLSSYFYNLFTVVADKGSTLPIENVKADGFLDCMNIVYGKPLANYSPGGLAVSRLLDLFDLSTRLSLPSVRIFCSVELSLPPEEGRSRLPRYLLACHFNVYHCKSMLLATISRPALAKLDVSCLAAILQLDRLNMDVDDIRSLLARIHEPELSELSSTSEPSTPDVSFIESSSFTKKSATSDVVLIAANTEFHVNRMVMGSLSKYFHKLLVDEGAEEVRFIITGVDPSLFGLCLHIMHGNMPEAYKRGELSSRCMFGLLEYAYRFEMAPVKLFCEHEMCNYEGHEMDRFLVSIVHLPLEIESLFSDLTPEKIGSWLERGSVDKFGHAQCLVSLTILQLGQLINLCCMIRSNHRVSNASHHAIWVKVDRNNDRVNVTDALDRLLDARAAEGFTVRDVLTSNGYTQILPGNYRGFRPNGNGTVYISVFYQEGVQQGKDDRPTLICKTNPLNRNVNILVTKFNQVLQTRNGTLWMDIYGRNHQRNKW